MVRKSEKLMTGWLFTSPDGKTKPVDLPHTWNGKDGQDGGNDYMRDQCTQSVFIWNLQESMHPAVSVSTEKKSQLMTADIRRFEWKSQSNYREKMNWFCTWIIKQATRYILSGRILRFTAGFTGMLQF